ncbi:MAG TPA: IS1595 family transposase [Flavobacterium sp.]
MFDNLERVPYQSEEECLKYLERLRWGGIITSPFSKTSRVYNCSKGRYKCYDSGKYFNVKTNTLFHNTKIPLGIWFVAIQIFEKEAITSVDLAKRLGITQKSSWTMLRKMKKHFNSEIRQSSIGQKQVVNNAQHKFNLVEWLNRIQ